MATTAVAAATAAESVAAAPVQATKGAEGVLAPVIAAYKHHHQQKMQRLQPQTATGTPAPIASAVATVAATTAQQLV